MTFPTSMLPRRAARSPIVGASRFVPGPKTAPAPACHTMLVLLVTACGGGAGSAPSASPDASATDESEVRFSPPNEISQAEIMERGTNAHDAMGLIRRLRPAWLQSRGSPAVYVGNMRQPRGVNALFNIPIGQIRLMEFIRAADATTRWGTGHMGGVIRVVTGR